MAKEEFKLTTLQEALLNIQAELKAPKSQWNAFGKYNYRNAEDIQEAVKPLLLKYNVLLTLSDRIEQRGDRYYLIATAKLSMAENSLSVTGEAREEESKKGMDGSQVTGASSSYARKYALNGLFLIDDTKDSDGTNTGDKEPKAAKAAKVTEPKTGTQEQQAPPQSALKPIEAGTKGFEGAAQWIASTEGLIFDVLDQLKSKYTFTPEVEKSLAERASAIRLEAK